MSEKATGIIAAMLLWGVFFIKYQVLLLAGLMLAVVSFVLAVKEGAKVDRIFVIVAANIGFWILSGVLSGGLTLGMMASPQYLTEEGRGFLYYIPLLTLSAAIVGNEQLFRIVRATWVMGIGAIVLFVIWFAIRPQLLSGGPVGNYYGFVTSHTGAGTFFAIIGIFLAVYGHQARRKPAVIVGILMVLPVFGSASRAALVGMLAVLGWYVVRLGRARVLGWAAALLLALVALMPVLTPHTWERTAGLLNMDTVDAVVVTLEKSNWEPGLDPVVEGRQYNVLARFLYWEYTVRQIAASPFIGSGFGRFNDTEAEYVGKKGLVWVAASGPTSPLQLQAHNSYLHLTSELGIIGMGLMMWLWLAMYRDLKKAERCLVATPDMSAYFTACQALIIFVFACSLFGHAFASPIIGIPVLTIIAVGLGFRRRLACVPA